MAHTAMVQKSGLSLEGRVLVHACLDAARLVALVDELHVACERTTRRLEGGAVEGEASSAVGRCAALSGMAMGARAEGLGERGGLGTCW